MRYEVGDIIKLTYYDTIYTNANLYIIRIIEIRRNNQSITGDEYLGFVHYDRCNVHTNKIRGWFYLFSKIKKISEDELMVELL